MELIDIIFLWRMVLVKKIHLDILSVDIDINHMAKMIAHSSNNSSTVLNII